MPNGWKCHNCGFECDHVRDGKGVILTQAQVCPRCEVTLMPNDKIEEINKALEAALQGKWERTGEGWFNVPNCAKIVVKDEWGQTYIADTYAGNHQEANAHLIANAPEWLKWQQAEIERLRSVEHTLCLTIGEADKALQQSREENERLQKTIDHQKWLLTRGGEGIGELMTENERLRDKLQQIDGQRMDAESEVERLRKIIETGSHENNRLNYQIDKLYVEKLKYASDCWDALKENERLRGLYEREREIAERDDYRKVLEWYGGGSEDGGEKARDVILRYKRGDGADGSSAR